MTIQTISFSWYVFTISGYKYNDNCFFIYTGNFTRSSHQTRKLLNLAQYLPVEIEKSVISALE